MSADFFDSEDTDRYPQDKYHSFNRFNTPNCDNWSYASTPAMNSHRNSLPNPNSKYTKRSHDKRSNRQSDKPRPKPLQYEHEKYYDHVFPKKDGRIGTDFFYQPSSFAHAEL